MPRMSISDKTTYATEGAKALMNIDAAKDLAHSLMNQHDLTREGWTVTLDRAQNRLGLCNHTTKTISMGRVYVLAADEDSVTQTMLHEIAHALVHRSSGSFYGRREGSHGATWKAKAREIGYTGGRTSENPAKDQRDASLIEMAKSRAATVSHLTSGPLQMGERVYSHAGRIRGILLETLRTRARILNDSDGKTWTVPIVNILRENTTQAERVPSLARNYRTKEPLVQQPAVAPTPAERLLRQGDPVTIHFPAKPRFHGVRGVILRVNGKTYTVKPLNGSPNIRGTKGLFRLDPTGTAIEGDVIEADGFAAGDDVVIHYRGSKYHGRRGTILRVNGKTYSVTLADGADELRGTKALFRLVPKTRRQPLDQAASVPTA